MKKWPILSELKAALNMFKYLIYSLNEKGKKTLYTYLIFLFFSPIIDLFSVALIIPVLNKAMSQNISAQLQLEILGLGMILLVKGGFEFLKVKISNALMRDSVVTWSTKIYELYNQEELLEHNQKTAMQQIAGVRTDSEACARIMINFMNLANNFIVLIGYFFVVGYVAHWTGLLFFTLILAFLFLIFLCFRDRVLKFGAEKRKREIKLTSLITTTYGAYKEMKMDSRAKNMVDKYKEAVEDYAQIQKKYTFISEGIGILIQNLIQAVLFFTLPLILMTRLSQTVFLNDLIVGITVLINMLPKAGAMMLELNQIQYGWKNYEVFHRNMERYNEKKRKEKQLEKVRKKTISFHEGLKIENLTFHYPNGETILENASLKVPAGSCVAIIGNSGIGKTTFLDLILGLLAPQKGEIWYDDYEIVKGKDLNGPCKGELGRIISYIPQVVYLNGQTIRNNVVFLEKGQGDTKRIISCLKKAQIWSDVQKFPEGIDTLIGENGTALSGGQRQRIALARALYKEFELLIMDEATTGLDPATEREVMNSILQMEGKKTLLIVTHHKALAACCDHIYQIEDKKFVKVK